LQRKRKERKEKETMKKQERKQKKIKEKEIGQTVSGVCNVEVLAECQMVREDIY
jgi:hypothetical protein